MFAFLTCYLQCNLINHNMNYNLGVDLKSRSILKRYVEVGYGNKKDWEEESVTLSERASSVVSQTLCCELHVTLPCVRNVRKFGNGESGQGGHREKGRVQGES